MSSRPAIKEYNTGFSTSTDMLRLHLNETPYGAPRSAHTAAAAELDERCGVYPDSECTALRDRVARHLGVSTDMIAVGNGVDELVLLTALTFLGADRTALVTDTTFPGYLTSAAVAGAQVRTVPLDAYRVSPTAVGAALGGDVDVAFICNPVNPTGTVLDRGGVERIIADAEAGGTVVVFDEAYMDFAGPEFEYALDAVRAGRPVIVMRTFSKAWGLAALRVGYAVGPAELIERLWRTRRSLPFNVNRLAQQAAVNALDEPDFVVGVRERTGRARQRLYRGLEALRLTYQPSVTNFVLVRTGADHDSGVIAARLADEHQILVRDLTAFGLPGCLRVTVGDEAQVDRFCAALAAVLPSQAAREESTTAAPHWTRPVPTLSALDVPTMFNGYVGAQVAFALRGLGVWDRLQTGPQSVPALAEQAQARPTRVRALLMTAALLGQVELRDEIATLTAAGQELVRNIGFFTWGVGGYGRAMREMTTLALSNEPRTAMSLRDEASVASGSAEVGKALMLAVETRVLTGIEYASVADIGCGDGSRLIRLCSGAVPKRGLGLEISEPASALAAKRVADAGLADHIEISRQNVFSAENRPVFPGIELVSSFLMLHDLFSVSKDGLEVVQSLRAAFPDARYFLLADTAAQPWQRHEGPLPPFSLEFELMHAFMDVPIVPKEVYERAFLAGGLTIEKCEPFGAPSTWVYLLKVPSGSAAQA